MIIIKSTITYNNWGDIINRSFVEMVFGVQPEIVSLYKQLKEKNYLFIGSILKYTDNKSIVWGAGFIEEGAVCKQKPEKILAVRGPLTRKALLKQGISCPEVYGDPILLLPRFYQPKIKKKYKLGIVPHEVDQDERWLDKINNSKIKIINIKQKDFKFVDEVLECEKIASSSLHGLIVADAYGIPSIWLEFSDKVIGNGFKFRDYFASVGREDKKPLRVTDKVTVFDIMNSTKDYKIKIDLDKLWNARPELIK